MSLYPLYKTDCLAEVAFGKECHVWCDEYLSQKTYLTCSQDGKMEGEYPVCYKHLGMKNYFFFFNDFDPTFFEIAFFFSISGPKYILKHIKLARIGLMRG